MLSSGNANDSKATTAGVLPLSQQNVSADAQLEEKVIQNPGLDSVLAKISAFYPELSYTLQTQLSFAMLNMNTLRNKTPDDFVKSECEDALNLVNATRMSNTERGKLCDAIEAIMQKSQDANSNEFNATMEIINTLLDKALEEYQGDAVLYFMRSGYTMYRFDHAATQAISDIRVAEILYLGRIDKNPASLTYCHLANRMGYLHQASFKAALTQHVAFLSYVPEKKKLLEHQYFIKQVTSLSSQKVNIDPKLSMDLLVFAEKLITESSQITGTEVKLGTRYTKAVNEGISHLAGILHVPHAKQKTPAELKEEKKNLQKMKQLEAKFAEQRAHAEQKAARLKREEEAAKKLRDDKIAKAKKKKEDFEAKQKADNDKRLAEEKRQEAKLEQRTIRRVMTDILDKIEKAAEKQAKKEKKARAAEEKALVVSTDASLSIVSVKSDSAAETVTVDTSPMLSDFGQIENLSVQSSIPDEGNDKVENSPLASREPAGEVVMSVSDESKRQVHETINLDSDEDKHHTHDANTSVEQTHVAYQPYPEESFVDATHLTIHGLTEQCEAHRRTIERLTSQQVTSMPVPVPVYVPVHVSVPVPVPVPVPMSMPVPLQMPYFGMQGNFNQPMIFPGHANYYQSPQDPYFAQAAALAAMGYNGSYQNYGYQQQSTMSHPFYPAEEMPDAPEPSAHYPNPSVSQVDHPSAFMSHQRGRHQQQQNQSSAERKHHPRSRRHH